MSGPEPLRDWADALRRAEPRPPITAPREDKKNYAERLSRHLAHFLAARVRALGGAFAECRPGPGSKEGVEAIVLAGGKTKRVDVTLTRHTGLVLAGSVKTINYPSPRGKGGERVDWQRNVANRTGEIQGEVSTIHKRHPYAVVFGLLAMEADAQRRVPRGKERSTFQDACQRLADMAGRRDHQNEADRFEHCAALLYDSETHEARLFRQPSLSPADERERRAAVLRVGTPPTMVLPVHPISVDEWVREIAETVRVRNAGAF